MKSLLTVCLIVVVWSIAGLSEKGGRRYQAHRGISISVHSSNPRPGEPKTRLSVWLAAISITSTYYFSRKS